MILDRPHRRKPRVRAGCIAAERPLGSLLLLAATFLLVSPAVWAQEEDTSSWGYFFSGAGSCNHGVGYIHAGGGGEGLLSGGLGVGAEVGYLSYFPGGGFGLFSPGVIYAFSREKQTTPFVTAGYTLFFRSGTAHGFYFAGGVNRWIGDRWGIRIEGRNQLMPACREVLLEARFAIISR